MRFWAGTRSLSGERLGMERVEGEERGWDGTVRYGGGKGREGFWFEKALGLDVLEVLWTPTGL